MKCQTYKHCTRVWRKLNQQETKKVTLFSNIKWVMKQNAVQKLPRNAASMAMSYETVSWMPWQNNQKCIRKFQASKNACDVTIPNIFTISSKFSEMSLALKLLLSWFLMYYFHANFRQRHLWCRKIVFSWWLVEKKTIILSKIYLYFVKIKSL